jgi:hypothetical protein
MHNIKNGAWQGRIIALVMLGRVLQSAAWINAHYFDIVDYRLALNLSRKGTKSAFTLPVNNAALLADKMVSIMLFFTIDPRYHGSGTAVLADRRSVSVQDDPALHFAVMKIPPAPSFNFGSPGLARTCKCHPNYAAD